MLIANVPKDLNWRKILRLARKVSVHPLAVDICLVNLLFPSTISFPSFLVHPCDHKNGGCQHLCIRKGSDAICGCKDDYELNVDGKTCKKGKLLYFQVKFQLYFYYHCISIIIVFLLSLYFYYHCISTIIDLA